VPRQHTAQGEERKSSLLKAAEELFAAQGYEATRVTDICAAAGVTKSLFYWYFRTKSDLYVELVRTLRHELRVSQGRAMEPGRDPLERIRLGTEASVRFMAHHASYFARLNSAPIEQVVADALNEGGEIYRRDVVALVEAGQIAGLIVDDDPSLLAVGVVTTVSSYSDALRAGGLDTDVDELAEFVGRWVVRGLTSAP
jgi:AcrR family transcriptional regulator